jgi:co-chaperonin GroES (HSP10)
MTIRAVGHRVLVKPFEVEKESKGGIVMVLDEDREFAAQEYGTIVDIGPDAWKDFTGEPWANIGDNIIYSRYGGKIVREPNSHEKYVILNDEDVLARLEKDD